MKRRAVRMAGALLALFAAAAVLASTAAGLVGLAVALILAEPWSQGRMVAVALTTVGLALLVVAHLLDHQALLRALSGVRAVSAGLAAVVGSGGRR